MFRFTIRELVLLTLVVALGVGWWVDHFQSNDRLFEWKAHSMESVLIDESWVIEQNGWNIKFRKAHDPHPTYEFDVAFPD